MWFTLCNYFLLGLGIKFSANNFYSCSLIIRVGRNKNKKNRPKSSGGDKRMVTKVLSSRQTHGIEKWTLMKVTIWSQLYNNITETISSLVMEVYHCLFYQLGLISIIKNRIFIIRIVWIEWALLISIHLKNYFPLPFTISAQDTDFVFPYTPDFEILSFNTFDCFVKTIISNTLE